MTDHRSVDPRPDARNPLAGRALFLEPTSGVSGDMFVGAMLDLGVPLQKVADGLRSLPIHGYRLSAETVDRAGIRATRFVVILDDQEPHPAGSDATEHHAHGSEHEPGCEAGNRAHGQVDERHAADRHRHAGHTHRRYLDIRTMIERSELIPVVKERSLKTFRILAEAEGRIHGRKPDDVEFHEVGAVDSIVDIVGAMIALAELAPAQVYSSAVNVGRGTLTCQHGIYPVPAPATAELLRGIPTFSNEIDGELTTPTGAALLSSIVDDFGARPILSVKAIGYGAGSRNPRGIANVLRASLADESKDRTAGLLQDEVVVIESAIDDMNPQVFGYLQEALLSAGALDYYLVPVQMKKGRPGTLLTVLGAPGDSERIAALVLRETTTLGVRLTQARRAILRREMVSVETAYGAVRVKRAFLPDGSVRCSPEYEDCRRLALERGLPLVEVLAAASTAAAKECRGVPESC